MRLYKEILQWSESSLPLWQQDALRRLFQQEGQLSQTDYDQLYLMIKSSQGLCDLEEHGLEPEPLSATHLPTSLEKGESLTITSVKYLKNVNKIQPDQELSFNPEGMTIIYGGNGSGKSGYARVMKRACRARDQKEPILANVNDPEHTSGAPEATFTVIHNDQPTTLLWKYDADPPELLSTISVFDSHCARSYITSEEEVAYLPAGLDMLEALAYVVLPEMTRRLECEIANCNLDRSPLRHLEGQTAVGEAISKLDHQTDKAAVAALGTFDEGRAARAKDIAKVLREPDPLKKAQELEILVSRLKVLVNEISEDNRLVSDQIISDYEKLSVSAAASQKALEESAAALRSGESLLPGTGGDTWEAMFIASRKYFTEEAYPGRDFSHLDNDAVCPLCQQSLGSAAERLARFEAFVQDDIAKTAQQNKAQLETKLKSLKEIKLCSWFDATVYEELEHLRTGLGEICKAYSASLQDRKKWILNALTVNSWENIPSLERDPTSDIRSLAATLLCDARTAKKAANKELRQQLENEQKELDACKGLSACIPAVCSLIDNLKLSHALTECKTQTRTGNISRKSRDLGNLLVSDTLSEEMDKEFARLGVGTIKTKVKPRNDHGKILHQLVLDVPGTRNIYEVLSEGERRAIALGSFLAELSLGNHSGGIVFDDPVSSLDHWRRKWFAKRLAKESLERQVIVFTHEVVFLRQLQQECDLVSAPPLLITLEHPRNYAGVVREGLPWQFKKYTARIDHLEKECRKLDRLGWPDYPDQEQQAHIRYLYDLLRPTIERVVQDVVLNSTVRRFVEYIDVGRLKEVAGLTRDEVNEILRLMKRCHDNISAHDPSASADEPPPGPKDILNDIAALKVVIQKIRDRRK